MTLRSPQSSVVALATSALALACAAALACPARADEPPPQEILDELKRRLLEPPECRPHCAASPRLSLTVRPRELEARLEVGSAAATAVPLPGALLQWLPDEVTLDGRPATRLDAAKRRLVDFIGRLGCGSRVGLAIFSERKPFLLY